MSEDLEYVCRKDELGEGEMRAFKIGRISIVVLRSAGRYFALRNLCPHQGAELAAGWLSGTSVPSAVGEIRYGAAGRILRCPWHNWEFRVETGESLHDPVHERVRAYPVVLRSDEVFVDVGRRPAAEDPGLMAGRR